ncbi:Paired box pox-meso protein [Exaiptasia diaphana]|nr:Paired box pox-meso protein [Exaiptasia diaphana]
MIATDDMQDIQHDYWSPSQCYPWRVNQLGGRYINGKPLPFETRMQILYCAKNGVRPCDISRQMKITHGCISKLLSKFKKTGSMTPGSIHQEKTAFYELKKMQRDFEERERTLSSLPISLPPTAIPETEVQLNDCPIIVSANHVSKVLPHRHGRTEETQIARESQGKEKAILHPYKHSIDEILNKNKTVGTNAKAQAIGGKSKSPKKQCKQEDIGCLLSAQA